MEGEKRIQEQDTGKNGAPKEILKRSKKQGCTANLKATVFKTDPTKAVITTISHHNHEIGSLKDLQYLPLSDEIIKVLIETRLREVFRKRGTRFSIQQSFARYIQQNFASVNSHPAHIRSPSTLIIHRDQMVHADEIHNIYKKIQENAYIKHSDVRESIKAWLDGELNDRGFYSFLGDNFDNTYSLGFLLLWQASLLVASTSVCLDATHCVANVQNGILYTVVIRHPLTGAGCPAAYFYTNDHSMVAVKQFLLLQYTVGLRSLTKITIDMSTAEPNAIRPVGVAKCRCVMVPFACLKSQDREKKDDDNTEINSRQHRNKTKHLCSLE